MSGLFIPRKDQLAVPGDFSDAEREYLQNVNKQTLTNMLAIERWSKTTGGVSTRLAGPDGVFQDGDLTVTNGNGIKITRNGKTFFITNVGAHARAVEVFAPGTLAARTLLVVPIPNPVLTSMDCMFKTAPAGTNISNFAQLRVKGTISGSPSAALPFQTNGQAEYHLDMADLSSVSGSIGSSNQGGPAGRKGYAVSFHPTTNLTIGGIAFNAMDIGGYSSAPASIWPVRIGLCNNTLTGTSGHTPDTVPWINDTGGAPAYTDVGSSEAYPSDSSTGYYPFTVAVFQHPVALVSGTTYRVVAIGGPTATTTPTNNGLCPLSQSSGYAGSGNIAPDSALLFGTTANNGNPATATFTEIHTLDNPFASKFLGAVGGTALLGPVSISIELVGTPATPGADLAISVQV